MQTYDYKCCVLGIRTRGGSMEGADESIEQLRHPQVLESFNKLLRR